MSQDRYRDETEQRRKRIRQLREQYRVLTTVKDSSSPSTESESSNLVTEVKRVFQALGQRPTSVVFGSGTSAAGSSVGGGVSSVSSGGRKVVKNLGVVDVAPKINYEKMIQTSQSYLDDVAHGVGPDSSSDASSSVGPSTSVGTEVSTPSESISQPKPGVGDDEEEEDGEVSSRRLALARASEKLDQSAIFESLNFRSFFQRSTLLVERVLGAKYDPLMDYTASTGGGSGDAADKLVLDRECMCDFSRDRVVTSVAFCETKGSGHFFLSSHFRKHGSEIGGGVVVWSELLRGRPEMVFECENPVSCAIFSKYEPRVVIGGTYAGEILAWDMRCGKEVQTRSRIDFDTHLHPISGLQVFGTQLSHSLLSLSNEGIICEWPKVCLTEAPRNITLVELEVDESHAEDLSDAPDGIGYSARAASVAGGGAGIDKANTIPSCCFAFRKGLFDRVFVGTENGHLYTAHLYGERQGTDRKFVGHHGMMTGMDFHPFAQEFGDYLLTSSVDWSCILWNQKVMKPVYQFTDFESYVYDVRWSPAHPAMFATVDGSGCLKLWNLNSDTDRPIHSILVERGAEQSAKKALNRVCWSQDGLHVAVGSVTGKVYLFRLDEDTANPSRDAGQNFRSAIVKMNLATS